MIRKLLSGRAWRLSAQAQVTACQHSWSSGLPQVQPQGCHMGKSREFQKVLNCSLNAQCILNCHHRCWLERAACQPMQRAWSQGRSWNTMCALWGQALPASLLPSGSSRLGLPCGLTQFIHDVEPAPKWHLSLGAALSKASALHGLS